MEKITKEEQKSLGKYTHRYKALWDQYFWLKEAREHRIKTIGLEETPEEEAEDTEEKTAEKKEEKAEVSKDEDKKEGKDE